VASLDATCAGADAEVLRKGFTKEKLLSAAELLEEMGANASSRFDRRLAGPADGRGERRVPEPVKSDDVDWRASD
jgi:hypothetical protein